MKYSIKVLFLVAATSLFSVSAAAHQAEGGLVQQVKQWLENVEGQREGQSVKKVRFPYTHAERSNFQWVPTTRAGVPLKQLNHEQRHALRDILRLLLSEQGVVKVDAIIAAEAALGILTHSPDFRDPEKYFTAVFGEPGAGKWMLRFEGHHLSINLSFRGDSLVAATPLFLGVNPETIPRGPDKGLRALSVEVDTAKQLYLSLDAQQRQHATASNEWFAGFLTDAGTRRAKLGKPVGIAFTALKPHQQAHLKALVTRYVSTFNADFATKYLEKIWQEEAQSLRFFWRGEASDGEDFYYRVNGKRLLIEMETVAGASHIHAVWRDAKQDFDL